MALIKCPECGREFSEFANSCPCCGLPMNDYNFRLKINLRGSGYIFGFMVVFYSGSKEVARAREMFNDENGCFFYEVNYKGYCDGVGVIFEEHLFNYYQGFNVPKYDLSRNYAFEFTETEIWCHETTFMETPYETLKFQHPEFNWRQVNYYDIHGAKKINTHYSR